jgi:hypothetical protein
MTLKSFADLLFKSKYFAINLKELSLCLDCGRLDYDTVYIGRRTIHLKINLHLNLYWHENQTVEGACFILLRVEWCSILLTKQRTDPMRIINCGEARRIYIKLVELHPYRCQCYRFSRDDPMNVPLMSFVSDASVERVLATFIQCLYEWSQSWEFSKVHPRVYMRLTFETFTSQDTQFISLFALIFFQPCVWINTERYTAVMFIYIRNSFFVFYRPKSLSLMFIYFKSVVGKVDRLCGLMVRVPGYRSRGPGFDSRRYQIF